MSEAIDDVTIVGGGDSGLLTGLCVRQMNPEIGISVVDDFQQDVPRVGKSTYFSIVEILHDTLDIDQERFISEVKPIWKASVYFKDWCGFSPFHYPFDMATKFPARNAPNASEKYWYYYDELYASPNHRTRCEEIVAQRTSPWYFSPRDGQAKKYSNVAYHLDTERFNAFLRQLCRERDVSLVNDEVIGVDTSGDRVERVRSKSQSYESDLYVDASGFNRVIKGELETAFNDFGLPLDSALNARVDRSLADVVSATVIETGDYGWFWQIDTFDDRDLGYVFASEFTSVDDARAEFLDHCDGNVSASDVDTYTFTSGYYDNPWQGNCVAIGNAVGFVEPLQSTGLTANAHAAVNLSNLLSARGRITDEATRDTYNSWVRQSWESIYDFIAVHYKYATGDNEFWKTMGSMDVTPRVEYLIQEFDRGGFDTNIDPLRKNPEIEDLLIFRPRNFYQIMRCMGATSDLYETNQFRVSDAVKQEEDERYRDVKREVETHFTTRELYRDILGLE